VSVWQVVALSNGQHVVVEKPRECPWHRLVGSPWI
jgi:hypothetical protein